MTGASLSTTYHHHGLREQPLRKRSLFEPAANRKSHPSGTGCYGHWRHTQGYRATGQPVVLLAYTGRKRYCHSWSHRYHLRGHPHRLVLVAGESQWLQLRYLKQCVCSHHGDGGDRRSAGQCLPCAKYRGIHSRYHIQWCHSGVKHADI